MVVAHGDDFTSLGLDENIDWFVGKLQESFAIPILSRLSQGCPGPQEIRILNRMVSVNESGLSYAADLRHCGLFMNSLTLDGTKHAATPGVRHNDRDDSAEKSDGPGTFQLADDTDPDAVIATKCLSEPCNAIANDSHSQALSL